MKPRRKYIYITQKENVIKTERGRKNEKVDTSGLVKKREN